MKPSRAYRNNLNVVTRPIMVRHMHNRWGQLIGTLAFVAGEGGMIHVGITHVSKQLANGSRKLGYQIAVGRARLEYAICNGHTLRTALKSRHDSLMYTGERNMIADLFDLHVDDLPMSDADRAKEKEVQFLKDQNNRLHEEIERLKAENQALVTGRSDPWDDPTVELLTEEVETVDEMPGVVVAHCDPFVNPVHMTQVPKKTEPFPNVPTFVNEESPIKKALQQACEVDTIAPNGEWTPTRSSTGTDP